MVATFARNVVRNPLASRPKVFGLELHPDLPDSRIWTISEDTEIVESRLHLTRSEFLARGRMLLREWQRMIGLGQRPTTLKKFVDIDEVLHAQIWTPLAAHGNHAWRQLLDAIDGPVRQELRSAVHKDDGIAEGCLVFMTDAIFPWRMLYAVPRDGWHRTMTEEVVEELPPDGEIPNLRPSIDGFLGLKRPVDHSLPVTRPSVPRSGGSAVLGANARILDGYFGSRDPQQALAEELRMLEGGSLRARVHTTEMAFAHSIADDDAALVYAVCHGSFLPGTGGIPIQEIFLEDDVGMSAADFGRRIQNRTGGRGLTGTAVALFNACQVGYFEHDGTGILDVLHRNGVQAVGGPLVDIPGRFARVFGSETIRLLLKGLSFTHALWYTCRTLATERSNPLGLAYMSVDGRDAHVLNGS